MDEEEKLAWGIYYEDGSRFTNLDGEPFEAPATGVQVIVQLDDRTGRYNQCMDDAYIFRDGRWWGSDRIGMLIALMSRKEAVVVRFGTQVSNDRFQAILLQAEKDEIWPTRSGYLPREVRIA